MSRPRHPRTTHEALRQAAEAVATQLPAGLDYLLACSGGADSLALAASVAEAARDGVLQGRVGAIVVDHGLQDGSAEAARTAAEHCARLGLDPVLVRTVKVAGAGNEDDARRARYAALESARAELGADFVLTAHTADDQAEQVLLGLARGSGTRSLSGIPTRRARVLRPFLDLRRAQTEAICEAWGLTPWADPSNASPRHLRNRVRHEVLPVLREVLGEGIDDALVRTARLAAQDAALLDELAATALEEWAVTPEPMVLGEAEDRVAGRAPLVWELVRVPVRDAAPALRSRVLRLVAVAVGGSAPTAERTAALERLAAGEGSAGPVQLEGHVSVRRAKGADGTSVLRFTGLA